MSRIAISILLLFIASQMLAQITGTVKDSHGMPLSYVNVYVKNSSIGTTTNFDGLYKLKLNPGQHTIVYQYIGFQTQEVDIQIEKEEIRKDIVLFDMSYTMPEVTITSGGEDPAYAIIRKAQAKRKFHLEQNSEYECDAYVRGFNKIYNAPEKIMGIEVGDMDGALDSTRQGVVYLSESVSKLYVSGSKSKEVMTSSKISGDDQGYSFNSAQEMDFNFYQNTLDLNKKIISPIASNALNFYDYLLEGAHVDENGQLVNKIKVIPKNDYTPCFFGHIYINEDLWNINSVKVGVTSKATQLAFIDTLNFEQNYIPLASDKWMMLSNIIEFRMSAFGFEVGGSFACVYSNYKLGPVDANIFNREIYVVKDGANEKSEMFWDSIRPIPLTIEEELDYIRKDSIRIVKENPEYLDSMDRKNNKLAVTDILTSYSHQNSKKRSSWSISSPLTNIDVNTIQGWNGSLGFKFNKSYNKQRTRTLSINTDVNYSTSSKQWRPRISANFRFNRKNNLSISGSTGRSISQFNSQEPITERLNAIMTLFFRRNYLKAYDKYFAHLRLSQYIGSLFYGRFSIDYEDRSALSNNYDGSLFYKNSREFTNNLLGFEDHQAIILRTSLRIRFGERLVSYPDRTFRIGSQWPTLWLHYKKGINSIGGSDVNYDLLHASIRKQYSVGNLGTFDFYIHGGTFITKPEFFIDAYHFVGNQTHIAYPQSYITSFLLLPYYENSTNNDFAQFHFQHNFNGWLTNKLPGIRRLNLHLVGGYKYLLLNGGDYSEIYVGLDNIGYKFFRLLRVDAVWSKQFSKEVTGEDSNSRFGVVVGLKFKL